MTALHPRLVLLVVLIVALLGACAGVPERSDALRQAEQAVALAEGNPAVSRHAPVELARAQETLQQAEQARQADADTNEIDHLAYLARRQAQTAEAVAREAAAAETAVRTAEQRRRLITENREQEAALARAEARRQREMAERAQAELRDARARLQDMAPRQTDRGLVLTLGSFLFATDSAELRPSAAASLDKLATFLREHPRQRAIIEGHTDATGPDQYNLELSQRRARAVVRALSQRGIDPHRLRAIGYGKDHPVADNSSVEGRSQNRRVELVLSEEPTMRDTRAGAPRGGQTGPRG
ncbi:OmpA family protein [Alkalilimnicola sp. S0819]|uniref:OmpA family protein n=1 Tax=Alkalilimnicola sp. S0819 TaxID=2613922 RepID=UPI0012624CDA|nr:OmpA family protein [Alkalilimnicola sp. S0819]KAB7622574.1 OmpA family protein [Alkalilimnicola sp. S0819]MPQ17462.1 OmpA family protein [Alkalilimnicola sp. S0819]